MRNEEERRSTPAPRGKPAASALRLSAVLVFACGASACSSSSDSESANLPHFQDISSAPAAIARSARAVVRIETATDSYAGVSVAAYVRDYRHVAHYELAASSVANAAGWLYDSGAFSKADVAQILSDLDSDPRVGLGSKLLVEELRYDFGLL